MPILEIRSENEQRSIEVTIVLNYFKNKIFIRFCSSDIIETYDVLEYPTNYFRNTICNFYKMIIISWTINHLENSNTDSRTKK